MFSIENSTIQRNGGKWTIHDSAGKLHAFKNSVELIEMIERRIDILSKIAAKINMCEFVEKTVIIRPYKKKEEL